MPDVIGISETRIKLGTMLRDNIDLINYNFVDTPTNSSAGGAGLYILKNIQFKERDNLRLNINNCEDIWVETTLQNKTTVIGCIYRHPRQNIKKLEDAIMETLKLIVKSI